MAKTDKVKDITKEEKTLETVTKIMDEDKRTGDVKQKSIYTAMNTLKVIRN